MEVRTPNREPVLYDKVRPRDVRKILLNHYRPATLTKRLKNAAVGFLENILEDNRSDEFFREPFTVRDPHIESFLGRQVHIATEFCGEIDPLDIEEYKLHGGFRALERCLKEYQSQEIIDIVRSSGLRGRGGAGFPTGEKWNIVRQAEGEKKYLICNGDEGDPGAFMDRMILESYPFRVIEGMIIAAKAVGAHEGFLYIRAEYPLAVERIKNAPFPM